MYSPAALNSGERILRLSAVVTPKATNVGGTVNSSKVPDMESLPPIDGKPSCNCASIEPRRAETGCPKRSACLSIRWKYS